MNKNTSIVLIGAVAGIMVAHGALVVAAGNKQHICSKC